ncbi:alpha carbonic anhydrase 7 [Artemisia annua]|uniref:Alpha carbonic anhydrase 7 n=1 Tax=Artemisia annua TaxID=35608 RepID=A0A2U1PWA9_ARTAN|nr:alpha carbonic anhydrase 7 [Artemisia annua]
MSEYKRWYIGFTILLVARTTCTVAPSRRNTVRSTVHKLITPFYVLCIPQHGFQLRWIGGAGDIHINGTEYQLNNIHWHTPTKHTIKGKRMTKLVDDELWNQDAIKEFLSYPLGNFGPCSPGQSQIHSRRESNQRSFVGKRFKRLKKREVEPAKSGRSGTNLDVVPFTFFMQLHQLARALGLSTIKGMFQKNKLLRKPMISHGHDYQKGVLSTRLGIPLIYRIDIVDGHYNVYEAKIFNENVGLRLTRQGMFQKNKLLRKPMISHGHDYQKGVLSTRLGIPLIYRIDIVDGHYNVYEAKIFNENVGLRLTRQVL